MNGGQEAVDSTNDHEASDQATTGNLRNATTNSISSVTHNMTNPITMMEDVTGMLTNTQNHDDRIEPQQQQYQQNITHHQYQETSQPPNTASYASYPVTNYSQAPLGYSNPYQPQPITYDPFLFFVRQMIQNQIHQPAHPNNLQQLHHT